MDGWVIQNGTRWQNVNLEAAKTATLQKIDEAHKKNIKYLGIDFHDRYFSHSFKTWLNWYMWLVDYLKLNKIEFVNFKTAIAELESKQDSSIKTDN
jgi:protein-disulfide isomerase